MYYKNENVWKIKKPEDVNIIRTVKDSSGYYLSATLHNGDEIQLTEPSNILNYPAEPIFRLAKSQLGYSYFKDFGSIDNKISINKNYLTRLGYVDSNENKITTYAFFDDGKIVRLYHPSRKMFLSFIMPQMEIEFGINFEKISESEIIGEDTTDSEK